jgi:hypothetical protein
VSWSSFEPSTLEQCYSYACLVGLSFTREVLVSNLGGTLNILTEFFFLLIPSLRANSGTVTQIRARPFLSKSLPLHYQIIILSFHCVSRDSAVGTATGYVLDDWGVGFRVPVGSRILASPCRPDRLWGPPNFLYNEYRGLFPQGVNRQGLEAAHSPSNSAEFKNMWIYKSTPPYAFMV